MLNPLGKQQPFYIRSTVTIFGLVLISYALYILRDIAAPIAFSLIIAILLNPLVNKMQKKGIKKTIAIFLSLTLAILIVGGIIYFISTQLMRFGDDLPAFKIKMNEHFAELQHWVADKFNMPKAKQQQVLDESLNSSKALLGTALGGLFGILGFFILVPIYVFLFLYYKTLFLNFLHEIFSEGNAEQVTDVLGETKVSIQSYMVGLLLEALVVAVMNTAALLLLGVDYAILLGVIGALLNMLPYIGGLVAIALPVLIAAVTKDGFTTPLLIVAAYTVIQFIDNNFLVPFLVSSRVRINAFFSIVIVLLGGALWGIAGMFMSIPFIAIMKIIFDRIPELKPWGKLLGDEVPTRHKGEIWMRRLRRKEAAVEKKLEAEKEQNA